MTKIDLIKQAIDKADRFESKLTSEVMEVPFLGSLKIRALLNNLGAISINYLEIGSHVGGSFCSAIYDNPLTFAVAIDSWESDNTTEDKAYPKFIENSFKFKHLLTYSSIIKSDCFSVDLTRSPFDVMPHTGHKIDLYNFDAGHSYEEQRDALIYYKPVLEDEFIYCCDDWQYGRVKEGTLAGIEEGGYDVLFQQELLNPEGYTEDQHLNDHWWRGYFIALLKKK